MTSPPIRIVTFHTEHSRWANQPHPIAGRKKPHSDLIPLFTRSVRETNPGATLELLTNHQSKLARKFDFDRVWRFDIDYETLMLERLKAQRHVLAQASVGERLVFLDTDILVKGNLSSVFGPEFDVGVTICDQAIYEFERRMPYNNGVVFVKRDVAGAVVQYFDRLICAVENLAPEYWAWSGNQLVVANVLGQNSPGELVQVEQIVVKIFPCSTYNYTPTDPGEDVSGKCILHFQREAKALMPMYAGRAILARPDSG